MWDDEFDCPDWRWDDDIITGENKMALNNYMTSSGHSFKTEDEAIDAAKKRAFKYAEDVNIYKAYKVAKTTTPNVEVSDVVI